MKVSVKTPATIANLGPGFDSFGLALPLYNIISVEETVLPGSGIEINIIDEVYTIDEVIDKALELGRSKINAKLGESEFIITEKKLKLNIKNSKIVLDMFYSTYENITDYEEIG